MIGTRRGHRSLAVLLALTACTGAQDASELPNPASVHCEEQGGRVEIVAGEDGEAGVCVLPDGTRIDEWELYRQDAGNG
jgi:uncharacterized protein